MLQLKTKLTTRPAAEGLPKPKAAAQQWLWRRAELGRGSRTSPAQGQPPSCSPRGGARGAGNLPQLCLGTGSKPQASQNMHGVRIPTGHTGKAGALLLSLDKLKQLWKPLAQRCRCFQMERQLKAGSEGPSLGLRHLFLHRDTLRNCWERSTGEDVVPIFNLLWLYKY